jgi:H+/Cl- antiporter ClcA
MTPVTAGTADPLAPLRQRAYLSLLVFAAVLGIPIAAFAYGFLNLTGNLQRWTYTDLPHGLGFDTVPTWWPLPVLLVAGLVVGLTVRYLPGHGGASPAEGFHAEGVAQPRDLVGIFVAAVASIGLGAVIGPEAPLVALGGGLAYLIFWLGRRDAPAQAGAVVAATGSFAAVSTLLGSPLVGAFLLMEILGLGASASVVLVPGLLGAGIGALIFVGLGSLTGQGTFSLAIPNLPTAKPPTVAELAWALAIGVAGALLALAIRRLALAVRPYVDRHVVPLTPVLGAVVALLAIGYAGATGHATADVLFSGQSDLPTLIEGAAGYSVGALLLLLVCKGLAYTASLAGFRGGPTFPAMFLGAAGGIGLSHLPGLPLVPAVAMGIGAMTVAMLRLPMTAVLLTTLFLGTDGITVMPVVIVAAVVSYVVTVRLTPPARASVPSVPAPGRPGGAPT